MPIPLLARHYKSTAVINLKAICVCDFDKPVESEPIRRLRPGQAGPGEEGPSRLATVHAPSSSGAVKLSFGIIIGLELKNPYVENCTCYVNYKSNNYMKHLVEKLIIVKIILSEGINDNQELIMLVITANNLE
ncbi:hypothetical protein FQA39_LY01015 [Lamprigera yunnana]|nr:hypothetical protein FQA39_LY01015 [Lamprigera yunnana]